MRNENNTKVFMSQLTQKFIFSTEKDTSHQREYKKVGINSKIYLKKSPINVHSHKTFFTYGQQCMSLCEMFKNYKKGESLIHSPPGHIIQNENNIFRINTYLRQSAVFLCGTNQSQCNGSFVVINALQCPCNDIWDLICFFN